MKSRLIVLLLIAIVSFGLSSCENKEENPSNIIPSDSMPSASDSLEDMYMVSFLDFDDQVIKEIELSFAQLDDLDSFVSPEDKDGYQFIKWEILTIDSEPNLVIVKAIYQEITFIVTWLNYDGTILLELDNVKWGTIPVYIGETPTKELESSHDYIFTGWDQEASAVESNQVYQAQFDRKIKTFIVAFIDNQDQVITRETVEYGQSATPPSVDEVAGYEFIGWDEDYNNVTSNLVVKTKYQILKFSVTWKNYDGTTLDTQNDIEWQMIPEYTKEVPEKESDDPSYYYQFDGWNVTPHPIEDNQEYTATFIKVDYQFLVSFNNREGELITKEYVLYGASATPPAVPTYDDLEFVGWDFEYDNIQKDMVITAVYEIKKFIINWVNFDESILYTQTLEYGDMPLYGGTSPTKEVKNELVYTFKGWDQEMSPAKSNLVYRATFKTNYPQYYEMATDDDFRGNTDGGFIYIGDADYVIIPEYIKGVKITQVSGYNYYPGYVEYGSIFLERNDIKGVIFEGEDNIKDLSNLFSGLHSDQLELKYLSTHNVTNMKLMFANSWVKELDLTSFDTEKVESMSFMFLESMATTINLSSFVTSNLKYTKEMFASSAATQIIGINNLDVSQVEDMSKMFYQSKLKSLDISTYDTKNVINMSGLFMGSNLVEIMGLENLDMSRAEDISQIFADTKLEVIDLSNYDTSKALNMYAMFEDAKVKMIIGLNHLDTSNVLNMASMFKGVNLEELDLSNFDTSQVKSMGSMFRYTNVETLDLSSFDTSQVIDMSFMFSGSTVKNLNINSFNTSQVESMASMFYSVDLIELDLSHFNTGQVQQMYSMFSHANIDNLNITSFDTSQVISMNSMFSGANFDVLDVSSFDTKNVTSMRMMFSEFKTSKLIGLTNFNTSQVTNMDYMFSNVSLDNLDLSSFDTSQVKTMEGMFYQTDFSILDISNFTKENLEDYEYRFAGLSYNEVYIKNEEMYEFFGGGTIKGQLRVEDPTGSYWFYVSLDNLPYQLPLALDSRNIFDENFKNYDIEGWYLDPEFTHNIKEITQITSDTLILYPNFELKWVYADPINDFEFYQFVGTGEVFIKYIGNNKNIIIPEYIQADLDEPFKLTSTNYLFMDTDVSSFKILNELGEDVSSNIISAQGMFSYSNAELIDLTYFDTSNVLDMSGMFADARAKNIIGLDNLDTSSVVTMELMFENSKIKSLDLSSFDTSNVIDMSGMFAYSEATEIIGLENFNTSQVKNMESMFLGSKAKVLNLSNFDTSQVTSMYQMFHSSEALSLDLSSFDTSQVINMHGMFKNSKALEINISSFDTSQVIYMPSMFEGIKVKSLDITNFNSSKVIDMRAMFKWIGVNEIIGLENLDTSQVINMAEMFSNSSLLKLDLTTFNTSQVKDMSDMFHSTEAVNINLSSFDTSKVVNMNSMFSNSAALELDLRSFDTSQVKDMSDMFSNSKATTILGLDSFDTSQATNMTQMFNSAKATELDVSNFDTSRVIDMSFMFYRVRVRNLNLSNFDTSKVENMSNMFAGVRNMPVIDLSSFDTSKVTNMHHIFYGSYIKKGYAKNQEEVDKFTAELDVFVVKE